MNDARQPAEATAIPCLLCGTACERTPLFSVRDRLAQSDRYYDVLRCPSCGSVRIHPLPSADDIPALYPAGYNFRIDACDRGFSRALKTLEWRVFYRPILRRTYRIVSRVVGKKVFSVLDVGCGAGQRLAVFRDAGCDVEGNETSAACVAYIRARGGIPVHEGRLETLSIGRQYDVVTLFALLEHLADPSPLIAAAHKLLAPGGRLVIQVPVVDSLQFKLLGRHAAMIHDMPRHIFIPSVAGLDAFMDRHGFDRAARYPVSLRERATLCALGLMPAAATPAAYRRAGPAQALARALGWLLTLFPGIPVALAETPTGVGAETLFVYTARRQEKE